MIQEVPDSVVIAYIGRSNGAGPTLSAMSTIPVITVPASVKDFPEDIWSSFDPEQGAGDDRARAFQRRARRPANPLRHNPRLYAHFLGEIENRTVNTIQI